MNINESEVENGSREFLFTLNKTKTKQEQKLVSNVSVLNHVDTTMY